MPTSKPLSLSFAMFVAITLTTLATRTPAVAQTGTALRSFSTTDLDGYDPGVVTFDSAGNMYGTTLSGGAHDGGVLFEFTPRTGGGWTEEILHSFNPAAGEGSSPGTPVLDPFGNIYGSCTGGGAYGDGTIFELIRELDGSWSEHTVYDFSGGYGTGPSNVVFDSAGNLYATNNDGGVYGAGSVFKLTHRPDGTWVRNILHSFPAAAGDGYQPDSGVIVDGAGNIYGTTFYGGTDGDGAVYELSPGTGGVWNETILHTFAADGIDGTHPIAGVVFDSAGNLYGTTFNGGSGGVGTAFELTPAGSTWIETILHTFQNDGDGIIPGGGWFAIDSSGNLYNATLEGGNDDYGTIYKLTRAAGGTYTYATYFKFDGTDGASPGSNVTLDSHRNIYGPTPGGGTFGDGVLFEVRP